MGVPFFEDGGGDQPAARYEAPWHRSPHLDEAPPARPGRRTPTPGPRIGSLCTGYGGLDLAVLAAFSGRVLWCADNDPRVAKILAVRLPHAPNLGDITAVDWTRVPRVDVVTAGFPCQDISYAGHGAGISKESRSGAWYAVADAVRLLRPGHIVLENVAALRGRGLDRVLGDLATLGYDTAWTCLRACDIGAPHRRERIFVLAWDPARPCLPHQRPEPDRPAADPGGVQPQRRRDDHLLAGPPQEAEPQAGDAAGHRDQTAAHPQGQRHRHPGTPGRGGVPPAPVASPAAHPEGLRRGQGLGPAHRLQGPPDPARDSGTDWGVYAPAVHRWQAVLGRPAPEPIERGTRGQPRLAARFVEWMMGLPRGWVTDIDLPRTAHMHALGNGVVPQQATAALTHLAALVPTCPGPAPSCPCRRPTEQPEDPAT